MSNIDLESLPYPMFETTEEEKGWLRVVYPLLTGKDNNYYLCCALDDTFGYDLVKELLDKILSSLDGCLSLTSHFGQFGYHFQFTFKARAELRKIWIRKLLEYTGE